MIHPPTSRVRVRVFGDSEAAGGVGAKARTIARAVCDAGFVAGARVIKADGRTSVYSAEVAGYGVVVKTLALDRLKDRFGSRFRSTRLWRQATGIARVRRCRVPAATAYALVRGVNADGQRVEALIMERVEGPTLLRAASERSLDSRATRLLLDRLGHDIGAMASAGVFNRDHKPSNIILSRSEDGSPLPVLIDTADIRRRSRDQAMVRMLAKLLIETIGTSVATSAREQVRLARSAADGASWEHGLRELIDAVRQEIESHGDPTPRHDPFEFDS
jgi:tRNA A-37 threonylcarbamoyl transferase component Bud32